MIVRRSKENPILKPNRDQSWEAEAVFNGCPIKVGSQTYLLYRALSLPHYHASAKTKMMISDVGIAQSKDGRYFENRRRFIVPEHEWERFGCEDPRVTKLGNKYYVFYTAISTFPFNADGIKVGVAISKDLKKVEEKHLVTPFNAKGMTLFPEKIEGKIWALLTVHTDSPPSHICIVGFDKEEDMWSETYWQKWHKDYEKFALPLKRSEEDHVEVGAPPIKTKEGWLVLYSYIRNYYSSEPLFTVEAVLLDLKNPFKIIASTKLPILSPKEYYEKIGIVPNIVFPSGALVNKGWIDLYYGAADTVVCLAHIELASLLEQMLGSQAKEIKLKRYNQNPILKPIPENAWESRAVFNPAALYIRDKVHIVYRAMSQDNTSVFGYATSSDGYNIDYRHPTPIYVPREPFEQKNVQNGNSGCEDPRLTQIGNKIYMCYTAYDSIHFPRVALTWTTLNDFISRSWNWSTPVLISPPDMDDKDSYVFPEKYDNNFIIIHRSGEDIDYSLNESLKFRHDEWLEEFRWIGPRKGWWDSRKVGAAAPPVKTKDGWIMLYHGVSDDSIYRVGAILLDKDNPLKVIGRTDNPIFEPEMDYEKIGQINNVVFPCGNVIIGEKLFVYYGGADEVVGVATIEVKKLLDVLKFCKC